MAAPKFAKQPATVKPGAWVYLRGSRYNGRLGEVVQVVSSDFELGFDAQTRDGRTFISSLRRCDVQLLTPHEAAPFIAARATRLAREDERKANLHVNVAGNFGIRQNRRRW